ncbi:MAG: D-alanine--D-alanine ligase [Rikenellaceae bacterium]
MMKKTNIALLVGGNSSERELSLSSAQSTAALFDASKYNIYIVDINGSSWTYKDSNNTEYQIDKNDFTLKTSDSVVSFDYAMILIYGTPGEDGRLQGYLDMMGVQYLSCDFVSSVLTFDKTACKRAVQDAGIALAKEIFVRRGETVDPKAVAEQLGLPLFIKPNASGSSFGVSKVKSVEEILPAIEVALKESDSVLMEEFIEGTEVGCGMVITSSETTLFPLAEIVSEREFFDYQAKYEGLSQEIIPARVSDQIRDKVYESAIQIYKRLGCRGIVRVDFIIKNKVPYMIEINTIPGMTAESLIPQQARKAGVELVTVYEQVIKDICLK